MKHIFINSDEKLGQVLKRLKQETEKEVVFIIPKKALILEHMDNLTKLKQKAKMLKKKIKFISNDPRMKKTPKKITQPKIKTKKKHKAPTKESRVSSLTRKAFIIFAVAVLLLTSASLYLVLPKADILIEPKKEPLAIDLKVIVDQNLQASDIRTNSIPGQLKTAEEQEVRRFETTGASFVESKARGIITVYNNSKAQVWREETRFETSDGLIFKTLKFEKIPSGTKDIEVEAESAGEEYNIPASTFTLPAFKERKDPQYNLIYGKSENTMVGGLKQKISLVAAKDIENAVEELKQSLRQKLQNQISADVFEEKILVQEASVAPNTRAEAFNVNLKMAFATLVFQEQDLLDLVKQNLLLRIESNKELLGEPKITYNQIDFDLDQGQMNLSLTISQELAHKIENDKLKEQLTGKSRAEVEYLLQRQAGINLVKVSFWPFWVRKVPNKINIKLQY